MLYTIFSLIINKCFDTSKCFSKWLYNIPSLDGPLFNYPLWLIVRFLNLCFTAVLNIKFSSTFIRQTLICAKQC